MNTDFIRRGLYNIKTRSETMDAAIGAGPGVLPAVIPLLQDRDEGIRWAAIRILTEVGDNTVILPLITLLEQGRNTTDVIDALKTITGQDFGDKTLAWREWLLQKSSGHAAPSGMLSDKDLVSTAIKGLPATMEGSDQDFVVIVTLRDRRSQAIRVDFSGKDKDGHPLVQLTSPCGKATPAHYEEALKLNMSIPCGAIGLAMVDDILSFAIIDNHRRVTLHPDDLAESIMSLAFYGDMMEMKLSGSDTF